MSDEKALQVVEQKTVIFYGDEVIAVRVQDGSVYIINRDVVLSKVSSVVFVMNTTEGATSHQTNKMVCLPLDYLNGWLFGINATRVKEAVRDSLIQYQMDCYRVLSEAFLENKVTHRPSDELTELLKNEADPAMIAYKSAMAAADLARAHLLMQTGIEENRNQIQMLQREVALIQADLCNKEHFVTNSQASQISQAVRAIGLELGKRSGRNEYGGVYGELYRSFGITSYKQLPATKFSEAMNWLRDWYTSLFGDAPF